MAALIASTSVAAQPAAQSASSGVAAYRAGDLGEAWTLLQSAAASGDLRAKRYVGYIIIAGEAPGAADPRIGVDLLVEAARAGDYAALVRLEELRQGGLAHAPSLADIIAVETTRAQDGDPVSAWRLAKRYETGDGVAPSPADAIRWLTIAAEADQSQFPKSDAAAFKLCEIYASGAGGAFEPELARRWCARAADKGDAAASIMLRRLAPRRG